MTIGQDSACRRAIDRLRGVAIVSTTPRRIASPVVRRDGVRRTQQRCQSTDRAGHYTLCYRSGVRSWRRTRAQDADVRSCGQIATHSRHARESAPGWPVTAADDLHLAACRVNGTQIGDNGVRAQDKAVVSSNDASCPSARVLCSPTPWYDSTRALELLNAKSKRLYGSTLSERTADRHGSARSTAPFDASTAATQGSRASAA